MILILCEMMNLYSVQKNGKCINTNVKELEVMIRLFLRMGLCKVAGGIRAFWETGTRFPPVADHMARNRFQQLLTVIHFVDNNSVTEDEKKKDKLWKIRPWLDMFRKQCLLIPPEEHCSIDEQMIPFKGKMCPVRQYVKSKPHPWGLKLWGRATSTGFLCDFDIYQGKSSKNSPLGVGGEVVMKLCSTLPSHQN